MIVVDEEFKNLIPPLSDEEFQQLEENCVKDGIRDALVVWPQEDGTDILIDGHNRWAILGKHINSLQPQFRSIQFEDREAAKEWIIRNQFGRRNLSAYDRSLLALKLKPMIAEKAKANQVASGGAVPQKSAKPVDTREELAKVAGVSHDTIHKVEKIQEKASEQDKADLREGKQSINQVYNKIKEPPLTTMHSASYNIQQEKREAIKRHNEFEEKKNNSDVLSMSEIQQDKEDKKISIEETRKELASIISKFNLVITVLTEEKITELFRSMKYSELLQTENSLYQVTRVATKLLRLTTEVKE